MRLKATLIFLCWVCFSSACFSQFTDSTAQPASAFNISFVNYFQFLKGNLIQQSVAPFHLRGAELLGTGAFAMVTAGVMRADKSINHFALRLHDKSSISRNVGPQVTKFGGRYALFTMIGIGSLSYIIKDRPLTNATLLASQAYLTSGLWVSVFKFVSGRERPSYYNPQTNINEGVWHGPLFQFKKDNQGNKPDGGSFSSFSSGHAAAAFSIATTYAEFYRDKPWVSIVAYSSASLVALSRISESRHWASDVLVSSALGYLCGKQSVRNFRRLERLNNLGKRKALMSFSVNYINGVVMPAAVYKF